MPAPEIVPIRMPSPKMLKPDDTEKPLDALSVPPPIEICPAVTVTVPAAPPALVTVRLLAPSDSVARELPSVSAPIVSATSRVTTYEDPPTEMSAASVEELGGPPLGVQLPATDQLPAVAAPQENAVIAMLKRSAYADATLLRQISSA